MDEPGLIRFFPYDAVRQGQLEIAKRVYLTLTGGGHLVVQAPTGFGKTASLLSASLSAIERTGMGIYYIVRTHREAEVVMRELSRVERRGPFPFVALEMRGRTHLCPMTSLAGTDPMIASKFCRSAVASGRCSFFRRLGKFHASRGLARECGIWDYRWASEVGRTRQVCPYFMLRSRLTSADIVVSPYQYLVFEPLRRGILGSARRRRGLIIDECVVGNARVKTSDGELEARHISKGHRLLSILIGPDGTPSVSLNEILQTKRIWSRETVTVNTGTGFEAGVTRDTKVLAIKGSPRWTRAEDLKPRDLILTVVDGGLRPAPVRKVSLSGGEVTYDFITVPCHNYVANGLVVHNSHNLPAVLGGPSSARLRIIDLEEALLEALFLKSYLSKFIERFTCALKGQRPREVKDIGNTRSFLEEIEQTSSGVDPLIIFEAMRSLSERSQGHIIASGGMHESALARVYSFFRTVAQAPPDGFLQYVPRERFSDDHIELSWWDPKLGNRIFSRFQSTVHVSGTNDWPDAYAALVGLPSDYSSVTVNPPMKAGNCFVGVLGTVTTAEGSRTQDNYELYSRDLAEVLNSLQGRSALFVPSFEVLRGLRGCGFEPMIYPASFWESEDMDSYQHEVMIREFVAEPGEAVLVGVIGGRSSEGVDFGPGVLNNSIVFGVPFPEPGPTRVRYTKWLDSRFKGKGSDYAYVYPAVVRSAQALGRAPRSPTDRVVCVLADRRFREPRLMGRFPRWIKENNRGVYVDPAELIEDVERFYSAKPSFN